MNLVVVESPSKSKTIKKYLGKDYTVLASKGHVADLPKSELGVEVEKNFEPKYIVTNKKSLAELKKAYKDADKLILAVDLDREGEAIAWHVAQRLGAVDKNGKPKKDKKVERIVFDEITKDAINEAIKKPRSIDINLVNAQQSRRVLDRLVGYKLSPLLWKKIAFGLSAGRVQSVALRLVVEREEERDAFKAEEYWSIEAYSNLKEKGKVEILSNDQENETDILEKIKNIKESTDIPLYLFKIEGKTPKLTNIATASAIVDDVKDKEWIINNVEISESLRYPKPPFITSTLQQTASNWLGMSAKRTMMAAQALYEAGFITYMRTDSLHMSVQAVDQVRSYINKKFGVQYLPQSAIQYKTKSKLAQEAHECIRPVDFTKTADDLGLTDEKSKIYNLIRNRALSSQMTPAKVETISLFVDIGKYQFKSSGQRITFDGYLKVYPEKISETILPVVSKGDQIYPEFIVQSQHFTQPPARYSEASLIKKLEELGIGRPSTYVSIISTIQTRNYIEKDGKYFVPTDVGKVVIKLLKKYFLNIVDYGFTAQMEENLDKVAVGKLDWVNMLKDFYLPFEKELKEKDKTLTRDEFKILGQAPGDIKCPKCGSKMVIKLGKYGRFYSCSKFPDCDGMLGIEKEGDETPVDINSDEFTSLYEKAPKTDDGREYVLKTGRFGKFWAHPDYPKVKDARPLTIKPEKMEEIYGEIPKTDDGRMYILKKGRFGEFWAHPDYPKVKDIKKISKKK
jgi:DNA topoisomerase-1